MGGGGDGGVGGKGISAGLKSISKKLFSSFFLL